MKLIINNVGKIHGETTIAFDGITVLAGDNGSGKSTISKALYCMFHGFYDIEQRVYHDREREIANIILSSKVTNSSSLDWNVLSSGFINRLMDDYDQSKSIHVIIDRINEAGMQLIDGLSIEELAQRIERVLLIPNQEICERLLIRTLQEKYDGNVANVNFSEDECFIRLIVKNKELSVGVSPDGKVQFGSEISLSRDVIYIDDSYSDEKLFGRSGWYYSPYKQIQSKLRMNTSLDDNGATAVGELLNEKKASTILSLMENAGIGEMKRDENGRWVYSSQNLRKPIGVENISSGTKAFLTLKFLIMNNQIEKKGVFIFDEPEVHLHPKWQELYAEIIVLLQKTYDLTLLISTHSADFVSFLEYYTRKYQRNSICNYYLMNNSVDGLYATAENVTKSIDSIYRELSTPYIRVSEELVEEENT